MVKTNNLNNVELIDPMHGEAAKYVVFVDNERIVFLVETHRGTHNDQYAQLNAVSVRKMFAPDSVNQDVLAVEFLAHKDLWNMGSNQPVVIAGHELLTQQLHTLIVTDVKGSTKKEKICVGKEVCFYGFKVTGGHGRVDFPISKVTAIFS